MATAATAGSNGATRVAGMLAVLACGATLAAVLAGETAFDRPWLVLFLAVAATIAVTQSVDFGPDAQFDGAQPITILAGILGGPLAGAGTGVVSTIFYNRPGGSRLTYGSIRALQGLVAGVIVYAPMLRFNTAPRALGVGVATEAAAAAVMLVATILIGVLARRGLDPPLAMWNYFAALLAAPLIAGLALADVRAGAGPVVLVLVPGVLAVGATRIFRERWRLRHAESEARANRDPLTGAYNRRWFESAIASEIASGNSTGLVLLDLDHFKNVNDKYGHTAGDGVLLETVQRLVAGVRPGDGVVRWGGEEFAILLRQLGDDADLAVRAEQLRRSIGNRPFEFEGNPIAVTASAGAATLASDADSLVRAADAALYDAKRTGRDRAVLV
jgi:diguanylate cyclase (GGDEF)-like protein